MPCWFSISSFVVSVTPSLITLECSNNFVIFIISFISSFKINEVNPFPALTGPCPVIFLSNLFIAFEAKLFTNLGQLSLAKGIARSAITFYEVINVMLSIDILLPKAFLILVVCLFDRNNSCDNSSP